MKIKTNLRQIVIYLVAAAIMLPTLLSLTACDNNAVTIRVHNWGEYLDEDILEMFTEETGIQVIYTTYINNEYLYTEISRGGAVYDVIFPSDYMIERMINESLLRPLNWDNIPNATYIGDKFRDLQYDPQNRYSAPYMWGTFGILYNRPMLESMGLGTDEEVNSWNILWDERFSGQIYMHSIARESFTVALQRLGFKANSTDSSELNQARDLLIQQRPLVQGYFDDAVKDKMVGNEGALAATYNGNAMYAIEDNPDLNYVIPNEGGMMWFDSMVIPHNSRNPEAAEAFINFMIRPDIALMNTEWIGGFSVANMGAFELLDAEWQENPIFWPPAEKTENSEILIYLGDFMAQYERLWTEVRASR